MEQLWGNMCDVCGCVYHWEMFFHNHLRDVHDIPMRKSKRTSLGKTNRALLESYYYNVCKRPTLEEIEHVAICHMKPKRKQCIGGLWIGTNENGKLPKLSSERNRMSTGKDVLIEFLLELSKEKRDQRREETEDNAGLIKKLVSKLEKLKTDLILEWHLYQRGGRIVCDGEDEINGWFPNIPDTFPISSYIPGMFPMPFDISDMFPMPSRRVQTCLPQGAWDFRRPKNRSDHIALWLVDISGYKTGVVRIGHQCANRQRSGSNRQQQHVNSGEAKGEMPSMLSSRTMMGKYWFTSGITPKFRRKITGIWQKAEWHWIWVNGINLSNLWSTLMLKWNNFAVRMSKLNWFLQRVLKEIYSLHLVKMNEYVVCLCYGC